MMADDFSIEGIRKWWERPYRPTYRGKPMTNGHSLMLDCLDATCFIGMIIVFAFLLRYTLVDFSEVVQNRAVCQSVVPEGYHFVSADGNDSCSYASDSEFVQARYYYDPVEHKYQPYKVK
jgi:hypothetical protein